jgi:hypothetical protein
LAADTLKNPKATRFCFDAFDRPFDLDFFIEEGWLACWMGREGSLAGIFWHVRHRVLK